MSHAWIKFTKNRSVPSCLLYGLKGLTTDTFLRCFFITSDFLGRFCFKYHIYSSTEFGIVFLFSWRNFEQLKPNLLQLRYQAVLDREYFVSLERKFFKDIEKVPATMVTLPRTSKKRGPQSLLRWSRLKQCGGYFQIRVRIFLHVPIEDYYKIK